MKQLFIYLSFLALVLLSSCEDEKSCLGINCSSEPEPFNFEFVDNSTGENLITNGTYNIEDFEVIATSSADSCYVIYFIAPIAENNEILVIYDIGGQTEQVNCVIKICGEDVLHLYVDAERRSENCCSWTHFNEIAIETDYELNEGDHLYTVKMDSFCQ